MAYLSTTELADMRTHAEATLPDTCAITGEGAWTPDGAGGGSYAGTVRGTAIACRLSDITGSRGAALISQNTILEGVSHMLSLHWDQTIELADTVTVGSDVYAVRQVNANESERLLTRAFLEKSA